MISLIFILLGSVFAPMAAIQIVDFFILKIAVSKQRFNVKNLIVWGLVLLVPLLVCPSTDIGNTLLVIMVTMLLCFG